MSSSKGMWHCVLTLIHLCCVDGVYEIFLPQVTSPRPCEHRDCPRGSRPPTGVGHLQGLLSLGKLPGNAPTAAPIWAWNPLGFNTWVCPQHACSLGPSSLRMLLQGLCPRTCFPVPCPPGISKPLPSLALDTPGLPTWRVKPPPGLPTVGLGTHEPRSFLEHNAAKCEPRALLKHTVATMTSDHTDATVTSNNYLVYHCCLWYHCCTCYSLCCPHDVIARYVAWRTHCNFNIPVLQRVHLSSHVILY
jgi:hypothetical protein